MNKGDLLKWGVVTHFVQTIGSSVINILYMAIGVRYFEADEFGIWLTIYSIIVSLNLLQFGMGNAIAILLPRITNNDLRQRLILRGAILSLLFLTTVLLVVGLVSVVGVDWYSLVFGSHWPEMYSDWIPYVILLAIFKIPLSVFHLSFSGIGKVHIVNNYYFIFSVGKLLALLFVITSERHLFELAIYTVLSEIIIYAVIVFHLNHYVKIYIGSMFWNQRLNRVDKILISSSYKFLVLNFNAIVLLNVGAIVINIKLGPESVTTYMAGFTLALFLMKLINAYIPSLRFLLSGMLHSGDEDRVRETVDVFIKLAYFVSSSVGLGFLFISKDVISVWLGVGSYPGDYFIALFSVYLIVMSLLNVPQALIHASNPKGSFVVIGLLESLMAIIITVVLVEYIGMVGVPIGLVVPKLLISSIYYSKYINRNISEFITIKIDLVKELSPVVILFFFSLEAIKFNLIEKYIFMFAFFLLLMVINWTVIRSVVAWYKNFNGIGISLSK